VSSFFSLTSLDRPPPVSFEPSRGARVRSSLPCGNLNACRVRFFRRPILIVDAATGWPPAPWGTSPVKGRAFGSPLARGLYTRASTAEVDPRASPGPLPLSVPPRRSDGAPLRYGGLRANPAVASFILRRKNRTAMARFLYGRFAFFPSPRLNSGVYECGASAMTLQCCHSGLDPESSLIRPRFLPTWERRLDSRFRGNDGSPLSTFVGTSLPLRRQGRE